MRHHFWVLIAVVAAACGGDGTGPGDLNVTGTFIGDYTSSLQPGVIYQSTNQLTQNGTQVTGTFTTTAGRAGNFNGSISGSRITATFTFTDGCVGSANTTADVTNSGRRLTGNYTATDCLGQYTGGYALNKQ